MIIGDSYGETDTKTGVHKTVEELEKEFQQQKGSCKINKAEGAGVIKMEKPKKIMMVIAPDVMQKYFEGADDDGSDESKLGEVIEKCRKFPDRIKMATATSAFIFALKKAEKIDGERVKNFLDNAQLVDMSEIKKVVV